MFIEGDNDFVNSTTIENGEDFIFSEEYHVVHHQSPGFHHTRYREEFEKKVKQGKYDIVFQDVNIFELAFTGIFRNYERLAGMVKDPKPDCAEVLKRRLRETIW